MNSFLINSRSTTTFIPQAAWHRAHDCLKRLLIGLGDSRVPADRAQALMELNTMQLQTILYEITLL